ncbi:MAG: TAXI family TRAP transporter solute-binding subunit [Methylobacteriaceae bacterium]|jgi:TRAP transporter TAXI family solute receptor|nr:TAXI family TRAP transporter solute-binding subunit [Methylobacteriaceae bacterium]
MRTTLISRAAAAVFAAAVFVPLADAQIKESNIALAAGSVGGSWFIQGSGLSALWSEKIPGLNIRVVPGGGTDNPKRVQRDLSQVAFGIDFLAKAAADGVDGYEGKHDKLRSLGLTGMVAVFQVYVDAAETRTLPELFADPKIRIGTTPAATSEYITLARTLEFYGNSPDKIRDGGGKLSVSNYSELIPAFVDGQIDVLWTGDGIPSAFAAQVLDGRRKARLLEFPDDVTKSLSDKFGYGRAVIPAATYPTLQSKDLPVAAMANLYLINADVSDDLAYALVKVLIDNRDKLGDIYKALDGYDPATAWKDLPIPLHPGAEKAYRDAGFIR